MAFVRWDPLHDLLAIRGLHRLSTPGPAGWSPQVDVLETVESFVVTAEVPGVAQEDVRIEYREGSLTISGVRRERDAPCEQYHRIERGHGSFSRVFPLPAPVDAERIGADLRNGVLTVTCPKAPDGPTRRIQIT